MKPKTTIIGLGKSKKELFTNLGMKSSLKIFALYNNVLLHCEEVEVLREFLTNASLILSDLNLDENRIKKYGHFYYINNNNLKPTGIKKPIKEQIYALKTYKQQLEQFLYYNGGIHKNYLFEKYILENVLREFIKQANWSRVDQIINTSVLLGANFTYFYNNL